jgi:hypothetical protein
MTTRQLIGGFGQSRATYNDPFVSIDLEPHSQKIAYTENSFNENTPAYWSKPITVDHLTVTQL